MSFFAYGATMRIFGATVGGGRALSAIVGTLTVLTTFILGRTLGGPKVGWGAAWVMAFSSYHIHYSRLASNQIFDPLIGTLGIWLLWAALSENRGSSSERSSIWGLTGVVAGLGWYAYFGARWVTFLIALILVLRSLIEPRFLIRHRLVVLPIFGSPSLTCTMKNSILMIGEYLIKKEIARLVYSVKRRTRCRCGKWRPWGRV